MNPSDSKKLEELDDLQHYMEATSRLSAKVKEQDREIERLRSRIASLREGIEQMRGVSVANFDRAEKAEAERDKLLMALRKARDHLEYCGYGDDWGRGCAYAEGLPELLDTVLAEGE